MLGLLGFMVALGEIRDTHIFKVHELNVGVLFSIETQCIYPITGRRGGSDFDMKVSIW